MKCNHYETYYNMCVRIEGVYMKVILGLSTGKVFQFLKKCPIFIGEYYNDTQ